MNLSEKILPKYLFKKTKFNFFVTQTKMKIFS